MPSMTKAQARTHVIEILDQAVDEVELHHWGNALLIVQRAVTEILLIDGKKVSVNPGVHAAKVGTQQSSSVVAGFNVLACFKPGITLLGIAEISDITKMARSTTHRYVRTLVTLGQLEQDPATRKYRRI